MSNDVSKHSKKHPKTNAAKIIPIFIAPAEKHSNMPFINITKSTFKEPNYQIHYAVIGSDRLKPKFLKMLHHIFIEKTR